MASIASGSSALAQRYASALFELADDDKALDQVAEDLKALRQALIESADLRQLVRSPLIGRDQQAVTMTRILEKAGAADITRRFVGVVAANRRLFAISGMIDAYLKELAERRGEISATVTAAHDLTEEQTKALTDEIKKAVGAKVTIDVTVDPALLGGLVVQVGSRMVDNSLRTKLNRMQLAMKGVA